MSGIGAEGRKAREKEERFVQTSAPSKGAPPLQEAVDAAKAPLGPDNDAKGKGGILKDHAFDLEFIDKRGYRWSGHFKCHAITYKERIDIGIIRSRMSGGVPIGLLDVNTSNLLEMLAHLAVAIDVGPEWAKKLEGLHDPAVVIAIYEEVANHEERFHGAGPSNAGTTNDAGQPVGDGAGGVAENE
jgi:hypothetical protein